MQITWSKFLNFCKALLLAKVTNIEDVMTTTFFCFIRLDTLISKIPFIIIIIIDELA